MAVSSRASPDLQRPTYTPHEIATTFLYVKTHRPHPSPDSQRLSRQPAPAPTPLHAHTPCSVPVLVSSRTCRPRGSGCRAPCFTGWHRQAAVPSPGGEAVQFAAIEPKPRARDAPACGR